MDQKNATYIAIRWDDGSMSMAHGDAAKAIMDWYQSCEVMNCIHGAEYTGPNFTYYPPPGEGKDRPGPA